LFDPIGSAKAPVDDGRAIGVSGVWPPASDAIIDGGAVCVGATGTTGFSDGGVGAVATAGTVVGLAAVGAIGDGATPTGAAAVAVGGWP
jgi:hypothetical protein